MSSPVTPPDEIPEMTLSRNPSFKKAMPSTAGAMREAEAAVPALGVLTLVLAAIYFASLLIAPWTGTAPLTVVGYAALFCGAMAVIVLSLRSVFAYAILSLNAVAHETLKVNPIPVLSLPPTSDQHDFYASLAKARLAASPNSDS